MFFLLSSMVTPVGGVVMCALLVFPQMAENVVHEVLDWSLSTCLHRPGFPLMFWRILQNFGYLEPPMYVGKHFMHRGELSWVVHVAIPATPAHPAWEPWTVSAVGSEIHSTWDVAALKALTQFCDDHLMEIEGTPFALLPVRNQNNYHWNRRMDAILSTRHPRYNPYLAVPVYYSATLHTLHQRQVEELHRCLEALRLSNEREQARDALLEARDAQIVGLALQIENQDNQIEGLIAERDAAQQMVAQLMAAQVPPALPVEQIPAEVIDLQQGEEMDHEENA